MVPVYSNYFENFSVQKAVFLPVLACEMRAVQYIGGGCRESVRILPTENERIPIVYYLGGGTN